MLTWKSVYAKADAETVGQYTAQEDERQREFEEKLEALVRGGKAGKTADERLLAKRLKERGIELD